MPSERPILYSFRRCPYAMRARMAIAVADIDVELREVALRDKPAAMLDASPKGTVPVLVQPGGEVIDESLDVMRRALAANDPDGWLTPESGTLEDMLMLIDACDGDFKHHLDRYKYAARYEGADPLSHRKAAEPYLSDLNDRLERHGYLFGNRPCLADYAIMPFVRQFSNVDNAWFAGTPYAALRAWLEGLIGGALFRSVMKKYPQWHAGEAGVPFPESPA